jgi:hypothetical protein
LAVYIPDNQTTPFITKDGRIYRRTHDSSEPVSENNRYALDELVERGKADSRRFQDFATDERTFSKAEKNTAWASLYISPVPYGGVKRTDLLSTTSIRALLDHSKEQIPLFSDRWKIDASANLPFTTGYSAPDSVIFRQVTSTRDESSNGLAAEFDVHCRARFHLPLAEVPFGPIDVDNVQSESRSARSPEAYVRRTLPQTV